jgi:hypothetical protein
MNSSVRRPLATLSITLVSAGFLVLVSAVPASAASIGLGEASSFSVLAGSTVTNTGPSVISGDVGVTPGLAVVGFPPATQLGSSLIYSGAPAGTPQLDLTTAYNVAAGAISTQVPTELGNTAPAPGVYSTADGTLGITGDLVLDANGDTTAQWIFQADSTLITASGSRVLLVDGASACNVFWQVGSSATLGTGSTMVGTVMALTSISTNSGSTVIGRLLARNAAVTLINTSITTPAECIESSTFPATGGVTESADTPGGVPSTAPAAVPGAVPAATLAATSGPSALIAAPIALGVLLVGILAASRRPVTSRRAG